MGAIYTCFQNIEHDYEGKKKKIYIWAGAFSNLDRGTATQNIMTGPTILTSDQENLVNFFFRWLENDLFSKLKKITLFK